MLKFFKKYWPALLIFILSFSLYWYSACRTNSGYGDSDEMITVSYLLGAAHPPGYPLQMFLTKAFTYLPIGGSYAFRANIFAGFLHSLTLSTLYILIISLLNFLKKDDESENKDQPIVIIGIFVGISLLALSALFWLYSSVLEVFALNDFLTIITTLIGFKWYQSFIEERRSQNFYFIISCILLGIGLSHVQTFIMLFPGFFLLFIISHIKTKKFKNLWTKILFGGFITAFIFITINLSLFYLNGRQANVSWWFEQNLSGWWFHVRRGAYAKKYVAGSKELTDDSAIKAYFGEIDINKYLTAIPRYFVFLGDHFIWIGLILGFIGIHSLFKKSKQLGLYFFLIFFFSGVVLAMLMGVQLCDQTQDPDCILSQGVSHRQYLQGEVLWSIFVCLGAIHLFQYLYKKIKNKVNALFIAISTLTLTIGISLISHWYMGVNRNNTFAHDFATTILNSLPENAMLIASGDLPSMAIFYAQEVEGVRPDIKFFPRNRLIKKYYALRHPDYYGYFFDNATEYMIDLIGFNIHQGRDVFLVDFSTEDAPFLGLGDSTYFTIPYSYVFKIVDEIPTDPPPQFDFSLSEKLLDTTHSQKNYLRAVFSEYVVFNHINSAKLYSSMGLEQEAIKHAKMATNFREHPLARQILIEPLKYKSDRYQPGSRVYSADQYFQLAQKYLKENNAQNAYPTLYFGIMLNPIHEGLRYLLADFYVRMGNPERAQMHYDYLDINKSRIQLNPSQQPNLNPSPLDNVKEASESTSLPESTESLEQL